MESKIQSLSSSQKRKVIGKTKLLCERDNGDYILWDSYDTNLKAFGVERKDVPALIGIFTNVIREQRRLLFDTSKFCKKDINAIAKMDTHDIDSNVTFMLEVKKYTSSENNVYSKITFYNMNGVEKKYGVSMFFNEALTYIKYLNLWENCFIQRGIPNRLISLISPG